MAYEIIIKPSAEKSFARLEKALQIKIIKTIENLAVNPRLQGFKKLKSIAELYRIRVGDYRIIYSIDNYRCYADIAKRFINKLGIFLTLLGFVIALPNHVINPTLKFAGLYK
jgi:mRNA interferase RelE/StbE